MSEGPWCLLRDRIQSAGESGLRCAWRVRPPPRPGVWSSSCQEQVGECHEDQSGLHEESRVCSQARAPKSSVVVTLRRGFALSFPFPCLLGSPLALQPSRVRPAILFAALLALSGAFASKLPSVIKGTSLCTGFTVPHTCVRFSCPAAIFPLTSPRRHFLPPRFMSLPMRIITTQCIMFKNFTKPFCLCSSICSSLQSHKISRTRIITSVF